MAHWCSLEKLPGIPSNKDVILHQHHDLKGTKGMNRPWICRWTIFKLVESDQMASAILKGGLKGGQGGGNLLPITNKYIYLYGVTREREI